MIRRFRAVACITGTILLAGLAAPVPTAQRAADPSGARGGSSRSGAVFRSGVELVTLAVTVERPDGAPRLGLAEHDFRLYEEGIPQDIVFFGAETVPVDLVLMLDSSASMTGRMTTVREAARNFIRALRPIDRAAVMTVGSRVHVLDSFNGNAAGLEDGIDSAQVGGNTALYDALYMALKQFGELPRGSDEVRRRASARSFFPTAIVDLDGVYASIAKELANQYSIGYTPQLKTAAHEFRRVAVAVDAPNVIVRTRRGYIAGG